MKIDPRLKRIVATQPYPFLFATISGAHLYGFPSPDSDFDLRGAHVLPVEKVIGLEVSDETVEQSFVVPPDTSSGLRREVISPDDPHPASPPAPQQMASDPTTLTRPADTLSHSRGRGISSAGEGACAEGRALEMDIVSHDVRKFFNLLLKKNGYVLEQLFSPLIVHTTPEHEELKEICRTRFSTPHPGPLPGRGGEGGQTGVITKHHSHHYFGFAETQWKLFLKESPRRVKPLLYVYRVLLTGIHLMRSGEIEANLVTLNEDFRLPYLAELIERKTKGENTTLTDADIAFHESEYQRLRVELQAAHDASQLPELPSDETRAALNDLLVRIRLQFIRKSSS